MNLRMLKYLVALDEFRHFSRAAEHCHVSQPTLSSQIRKLEGLLGTILVERHPGRIMLTPTGEKVVARARVILQETENIRTITSRARDPNSGTVRVGIFPTLGPYLLPHVIPALRQAYPRLKLRLVEEKTATIISKLGDGKLDAGLLALPLAEDWLHRRRLFEEPFMLLAPAHHPLAKKDAIRMSDLADEELLLLEDGHCLRDQALEVCQLAGAHEEVDFHATSLETLRYMVAANAGITLMPVLATRPPAATAENLTARPFEEPAPRRSIAMVWRKTSVMAEFLEELARVFANIDPQLLSSTAADNKRADSA